MKMLVISGSPRRHGNSSKLADKFIEACKELNMEVFRFAASMLRPLYARASPTRSNAESKSPFIEYIWASWVLAAELNV